MPRLPVPGGDDGLWGHILNEYLSVEHNADGTLKTVPIAKGGTGATTDSGARTNLGAAAASDLTAHVNDTSAAHAGSAISFSPTAGISATNVQSAIEEVAAEAGITPTPLSDDAPAPLATSANSGVATEVSRSDHVHPNSGLATDAELSAHATATDPHTGYLLKSGGTMTGALTLSGAPTLGLHAATKTYVDGVAGVSDHGALTGLGDDDHTQYHTDARAVTWHNTHDHSIALGTAILADLSNVAATVPTDGQVLTFDTTNGWQPEDATSGFNSFTDHNLPGATLAIDVTTPNHTATIKQSCTVSFTGWTSNTFRFVHLMLKVWEAGLTITWPSEVVWHVTGNAAPTLGNDTEIYLKFWSYNNGTTVNATYLPSVAAVEPPPVSTRLWTAVGGTGKLATAPDTATTWTLRTSSFDTSTIYAVEYSEFDSLWVAVGADSKIATSTDGITWTQRTSGFGGDLVTNVSYNETGDLWVAVGSSGKLATSPDGITWTLRTSSFGTTAIWGIGYSSTDSLWVITGSSGKLATSPDGITWTQRTSGFGTDTIYAASYSSATADLWVIVGDAGKLATSPDGITWTLRTSSFGTSSIRDIGYSVADALWVAGGESGKLATSPDGITWTQRTSGFGTSAVMAVDYSPTDDKWVIAGLDGKLATSPDGITWTLQTSNFGTSTIEDIALGRG